MLYSYVKYITLPKASAAPKCLSGHAGAVNSNTAGAETTTDKPWGLKIEIKLNYLDNENQKSRGLLLW